MNRLTLIITLCLVISGITYGQSRFLEGYIVTNKFDTISGLIEYLGNQTHTQKCVFKENKEAAETIYYSKDIRGYRYGESKFYVSRDVQINGKTENMFLEYLVDGVVDLYCYYVDNHPHYLIQTENDSLIELKSTKKVLTSSELKSMYDRKAYDSKMSGYMVYESKNYVYVLKTIFKNSPKISAKADNAVLDHGSLINLASSYHKEVCPDEECKIYKKGNDGHLKSGLTLGMNYVNMPKGSNSPYEYYYLEHCDFEASVFPFIGFFILSNLPGINANLYFQFEGSVTRLNLKSNSTATESGFTYFHDIEYSQTSLCSNAILKYTISEKRVKPVVQLGIFLNYGVGESFSRRTVIPGYTNISDGRIPFNIVDYGPLAGAGIMIETAKKKTIMIDLRYQLGTKFSIASNVNYFTLGTGIQL